MHYDLVRPCGLLPGVGSPLIRGFIAPHRTRSGRAGEAGPPGISALHVSAGVTDSITYDRLVKAFYLVCAIAGAVLPYSQFVPWLGTHGPDLRLFVLELFSTRIGAFFGLDVLVCAAVVVALIWTEGRRLRMTGLWLPTIATCLVGVSCGLPLFLFMRERHAMAPNNLPERAGAA